MMNLLERMLDSCEDRFLLYARKIFELIGSTCRTEHPQLYEIDFVVDTAKNQPFMVEPPLLSAAVNPARFFRAAHRRDAPNRREKRGGVG